LSIKWRDAGYIARARHVFVGEVDRYERANNFRVGFRRSRSTAEELLACQASKVELWLRASRDCEDGGPPSKSSANQRTSGTRSLRSALFE
jgi:hypothetical protein